jgi:hypothetical protein
LWLLSYLFCISPFYRCARSGVAVAHEHDEHSLYRVDFEWRENQMTHRVRLTPAVSYLGFVFSWVPIVLQNLAAFAGYDICFVCIVSHPHRSLQSSDL